MEQNFPRLERQRGVRTRTIKGIVRPDAKYHQLDIVDKSDGLRLLGDHQIDERDRNVGSPANVPLLARAV